MPESLLDMAYKQPVDHWAVFVELDESRPRSRFWKIFKKGFRHVEIWTFVPPGAWLRFDTSIERIGVEWYAHPPWQLQAHLNPTCVHVQRSVSNGWFRSPFFLGPITCVELAKAFLGIRGFWVRTPYQLYKYLRKHK